jgi:hypothetical protein
VNPIQRIVVGAGCFGILFLFSFPPWEQVRKKGDVKIGVDPGHSFLFAPPKPAAVLPYFDWESAQPAELFYVRLNKEGWLWELVSVAACALGGLWLFRTREEEGARGSLATFSWPRIVLSSALLALFLPFGILGRAGHGVFVARIIPMMLFVDSGGHGGLGLWLAGYAFVASFAVSLAALALLRLLVAMFGARASRATRTEG